LPCIFESTQPCPGMVFRKNMGAVLAGGRPPPFVLVPPAVWCPPAAPPRCCVPPCGGRVPRLLPPLRWALAPCAGAPPLCCGPDRDHCYHMSIFLFFFNTDITGRIYQATAFNQNLSAWVSAAANPNASASPFRISQQLKRALTRKKKIAIYLSEAKGSKLTHVSCRLASP